MKNLKKFTTEELKQDLLDLKKSRQIIHDLICKYTLADYDLKFQIKEELANRVIEDRL